MRIKHTFINMTAGVGNQLIITALSFLSRTVFIHSLGIDYLGVNALFTSVLAMISLAEAGIGSSIAYQLYKPVAQDDRTRIMGLMKLYRKAYVAIALVVLLLGLALMPFLPLLAKDANVGNLQLIYAVFLANTVIPYFFVYKHNFLNVNQKNYIVTLSFTGATVLSTLLKIGVLLETDNYIYYLIAENAVMIAATIFVSKLADRMYPYLTEKTDAEVDPETRRELVRNVKAILLQNVGSYFVFGAESLVISSFVSVAAVGLYSNYKMLIDICRNFIYQVSNNMYHSVGNLVAKESKERVYGVFLGMLLLNFWLYSTAAILLAATAGPFIDAWIGPEYRMGAVVLGILLFLFFERGMRNAAATVKTTAGIFREDRYAPLLQAALQLGLSLLFVDRFGIAGVFAGSLIGALAVPFWLTPWLVYRNVFGLPLVRYFRKYALYAAVGGAAAAAVLLLCERLPIHGWPGLALRALLAVALPSALYMAVFRRLDEYRYLKTAAGSVAGFVRSRIAQRRPAA